MSALNNSGADAGVTADLRSKLGGLIGLRQTIGTANGQTLAQLRAEVAAIATSATSFADQAQGGSTSTGQTMTAQQARLALTNVGSKLFDEHVLDPYLQFSSAKDEAEYRSREEERRKAYELEKAKNTQEGDLRAAEIAKSQLADAGAHGANRSPDFAPMTEKIDGAIAAIRSPQNRADDVATATGRTGSANSARTSDSNLEDVLATLKASGVKTNETAANVGDGHGLATGPRRQSGTVNLPG